MLFAEAFLARNQEIKLHVIGPPFGENTWPTIYWKRAIQVYLK